MPLILGSGAIGALKGAGAEILKNTFLIIELRQELEVERQNLTEFRRQTEFELSILEKIKTEISEIRAKRKALGC